MLRCPLINSLKACNDKNLHFFFTGGSYLWETIKLNRIIRCGWVWTNDKRIPFVIFQLNQDVQCKTKYTQLYSKKYLSRPLILSNTVALAFGVRQYGKKLICSSLGKQILWKRHVLKKKKRIVCLLQKSEI